jgi:hypothetical protein
MKNMWKAISTIGMLVFLLTAAIAPTACALKPKIDPVSSAGIQVLDAASHGMGAIEPPCGSPQYQTVSNPGYRSDIVISQNGEQGSAMYNGRTEGIYQGKSLMLKSKTFAFASIAPGYNIAFMVLSGGGMGTDVTFSIGDSSSLQPIHLRIAFKYEFDIWTAGTFITYNKASLKLSYNDEKNIPQVLEFNKEYSFLNAGSQNFNDAQTFDVTLYSGSTAVLQSFGYSSTNCIDGAGQNGYGYNRGFVSTIITVL